MAVERFDVDCVAASARVDRRSSRMGRFDGECVVACSECQIELFHIVVDQSTLERSSSNHSIWTHTQTGQSVFGQRADIIRGAVAVEDV